ncbi:MAG: hypothetical protein M0C28_37340 [Candidatus Moduliflexus flocculans]|nr:hypothetical protein [Candidatus Moduliflexus flocculans]
MPCLVLLAGGVSVRRARPGQLRQPERHAERLLGGVLPGVDGRLQEPPHGSDAGVGHE